MNKDSKLVSSEWDADAFAETPVQHHFERAIVEQVIKERLRVMDSGRRPEDPFEPVGLD